MAEVDYQMALVLQYKLDQENLHGSQKFYTSDSQLARFLQEQFHKECEIAEPGQNLVYKRNNNKDTTKSLTDPSWEVIDPTPDIHILFMAFNERFFSNKLLAVCVSWSKRMTTCAGICSYQGRGGMCSITLSEPLLKLRPRKDLVETLLHEMIHAYLFVTHNNRDREGHGPEFHKHMYRINGEAGTNITVYHDFHDEVRLYQQHWWRCNGPCQKWKPFFGMVRRAMNRAPGPSDRWWGEHFRTCGGSFIKVKEPEKRTKKSTKTTQNVTTNDSSDIRKFISTSSETSFKTNVHGIAKSDTCKNNIGPSVSASSSNIVGFTNLNGPSTKPSSSKNKGMLKNSSNTIVINKKPTTVTKVDSNLIKQGSNSNSVATKTNIIDLVKNETNSRKVVNLGDTNTKSPNDNNDYSVVRNHWLNKFSNNDSKVGTKRKSPEVDVNSSKISKKFVKNTAGSLSECPVCNVKIATINLNEHLDGCLREGHTKECIICGKLLPISGYEEHVVKCADDNFQEDILEIPSNSVNCEHCRKNFDNAVYASHYKNCQSKFVLNDKQRCGICEKYLSASEYDLHMGKCLLEMYEKMEASYRNNEEMVNCLACSQKICKSELDSHLEDCMSMSQIFDDDNEPLEEGSKGNEYNCPFCMKLILESSMNSHINACLHIVDEATQIQENKKVMLNSFPGDD